MRTPEEIEQQVLETLSAFQMTAQCDKILVGVSGGADSVALLHILNKHREALGIELAIGHVHHGIRGAEADDEALFVKRLADELQTPLYALRGDAPAEKKRLHLSTQESARRIRLNFLRNTAREIGARRVALAHTETDRVETILLRILRGTGVAGLEGFPAVASPLIRPLYAIRREETQTYCRQSGLRVCEDSSNQSLNYRRNLLRLELLPYLREKFNVEIDSALLRLAEIAKEEADYLDAETLRVMQEVAETEAPNKIVFKGEALRRQHTAMQRRVVRLAFSQVEGGLHNLSLSAIERALEFVRERRAGGTTHSLPNFAEGLRGESYAIYEEASDTLVVRFQYKQPAPAPSVTTLNVPGVTPLPDGRTLATALANEQGTTRLTDNVEHRDISPFGVAPRPSVGEGLGAKAVSTPAPPATAFAIPSAEVRLPLVARQWRTGDRMSPRGLGGSKKLQDLFTDAKIRGNERNAYPLLVDDGGEGKVWAVFGLRLAEGAEPLEEIKRVQEIPNWLEIRLETADAL